MKFFFMLFYILTFLQIVLLFPVTLAQQKNIEGSITYEQTGEMIGGATVAIKGTNYGTITDFDGNFKFEATQNDILSVSFVGYKSIEVPIGNNTSLNIKLKPDLVDIDKDVIIGYGKVKQKNVTGAVSTVSTDDFNKGAIISPQELLMGGTSGVLITPLRGEQGGGITVRIRGGASLLASNDPLIVIDGVPIDNDKVSGMSNPLNMINPNDIESFSVLKDASSTAIYGLRASNGVIIITTKKGAKKRLSVNYTGNASMSIRINEVEVFAAHEYRKLIKERYGEDSKAASLLGSANTNWQNEIFETAFGHDHNLSLMGAIADLPFRVSGGYTNQKGILKTSEISRYTGSFNINPSLFNNSLKTDLNVKTMKMHNRFAPTGAIGAAILYDPTKPVEDLTSPYGGYTTWIINKIPNGIATDNPVALLNQTDNQSDVFKSIGNLKLDYDLPFLPDLTATVNIGYDYSDSDGSVYVPNDAAFEYRMSATGVNQTGVDKVYTQTKKNHLIDFYLNYVRELPSLKSSLDVMAGYSRQHFDREDYWKSFSPDGSYVIEPENTNTTESYLISYFGRVNYSLLNKYIVTLTFRDDGTSRFSDDNKWGFFPSGAFAWRIDQEGFLKEVKQVSNFKLRFGYGVTGQQFIADDYQYQAFYNFSLEKDEYIFGDQWVTTPKLSGYNSDLKWEQTTTANIGFDFGFFDNRVNGSIDFYNSETTDLINIISVPAGTNFANEVLLNFGTLKNKGFEVLLNLRPIVTQNFFWEFGINYSQNKKDITKLIFMDNPSFQGVKVGLASTGVGNYVKINSVDHEANSFFVYQQVYDKNGKPISDVYVDRNKDGVVNVNDKYHCKTSTPKSFVGLSSRIEYNDFFVSFSGRLSLGNYMYNDWAASNANYHYTFNVSYLQNVPVAVRETEFNKQNYKSDFYVQEASFFKMDNISVGYKVFDSKSYGRLSLSLAVQNVFVITDYEGLDPEVFEGIDNNIYPRSRILCLGLILFSNKQM